MGNLKTTGSSKKFKVYAGHAVGHRTKTTATKTFRGAEMLSHKIREIEKAQTRFHVLTPIQAEALHEIRMIGATNFDANMSNDLPMLMDVWTGADCLQPSHGGSELQDVLHTLMDGDGWEDVDSKPSTLNKKKKIDRRTRRDRTDFLWSLFEEVLPAMTDQYMAWLAARGPKEWDNLESYQPPDSLYDGTYKVTVIDVFSSKRTTLLLCNSDSQGIAPVFIRHGLIPCAPSKPEVAFTIRSMELFRILRVRSPSLSFQQFARTLSDIHLTKQHSYLTQRLRIAFDIYNAIKKETDKRVMESLGRDGPGYRLRNACPACTYKVHDENELTFKFMYCLDGNDSAKRIPRREKGDGVDGSLAPKNERGDTRVGGGDYFLSREDVDRWAKDVGSLGLLEENDENPCSSRWYNMVHDISSKMWSVYEETGIFVACCRHSFVLLVTDMVNSGELSKYPLAIVERLLDAFGPDQVFGYDIACKFENTILKSSLAPKAVKENLRSCVGLFHGHAHNRLCQTSHLGTYINGMGLEDFETLERLFSRTNALAATIRHASTFHRHEAFANYFHHLDRHDTYEALSTFLCNNYRQALDILSDEPSVKLAMQSIGVHDGSVFQSWVEEERRYLASLQKEPPNETQQIEYFEELNTTAKIEHDIAQIRGKFYDNERAGKAAEKKLKSLHVQLDNKLKLLDTIENNLNILERWTVGSKEWDRVAELARKRHYQRALDKLEGLVVARIFELSKMNLSKTGYKMRKHIAKALQVRSQSICNAIEKFNSASRALRPPGPTVTWDQVVDYGFLSEFDLLRDSRQDVRSQMWGNAGNRAIMDRWFKCQRAKEEIQRVNVEIRRFITYIRDETAILKEYEADLLAAGKTVMAYHVSLYQRDRSRFDATHLHRFKDLSKHPKFTGNLHPGTSIHHPHPLALGNLNNNHANQHSPRSHPLQIPTSFDTDDGTSLSSSDDEDDDQDVINAYGITFHMLEQAISDCSGPYHRLNGSEIIGQQGDSVIS